VYYICNSSINPDDLSYKKIDIKEELPGAEAKRIIDAFNFLGRLDYLSKLLDITNSNGLLLTNFICTENLRNLIYKEKKEGAYIITEANRLVMNYCVASRIFLDRSIVLVQENKSSEINDLEAFIATQYDKKFAYRFFYKLRNFIVHDRLPFSYLHLKLPDFVELGCTKSYLLEFKKWGSVKKEIEALTDVVHIDDYLLDFGGSLFAIYLKCVFAFRYDILEAHSIIHSLKKKYAIENPLILIGKIKVQEQDIEKLFTFRRELLWKATDDLKKHPGVTLTDFD